MADINTFKIGQFRTRAEALGALERYGWQMIGESQIYRLSSATNFVDARKRAEVVLIRTSNPFSNPATYYSVRFFDTEELRGFSTGKTRTEMAILAQPVQIIVPPDAMGRSWDIPTTYPDGTGSLTPFEWVAWAKRELLYGTHPLPKKINHRFSQ